MATGAGKSVCYQVPALVAAARAAPQTTKTAIVVSPLISLMTDQVTALNARVGSDVACFLGSAQADPAITAKAWAGGFALVYITPELATTAVDRLAGMAGAGMLSLVAVDEAHCVSEWGEFKREMERASKRAGGASSLFQPGGIEREMEKARVLRPLSRRNGERGEQVHAGRALSLSLNRKKWRRACTRLDCASCLSLSLSF